jgi:hypothetical protein
MIPMLAGENGMIMAKVSPVIFFNNPAVAIELGQVDILKHLVEEIGVDVNAHRWSGYTTPRKYHLLHLAAEDDKACFDYLIARQAIDVCASVEKDGPTKLWQAPFLDDGSETAEIFDDMISHPSFDPNKPFMSAEADEHTMLPLHFTCSSSITSCESEETDHLVTKTKRLLDLGADPQLAIESLPSPLDFVANFLLGEETEQEKMMHKRLIAMMEEKVAARE